MPVLAAVDDGEWNSEVVRVAADLADAYDDELELLHVLPQDVFDARQRDLRNRPTTDAEYVLEDGEKDASDVAAEAAEKVLGDTSRVTTVGRVGEPSVEILRYLDSNDPRYLVVGGRKRSPVGKALFGSVTQSVLLEADRPVVTVMTEPT